MIMLSNTVSKRQGHIKHGLNMSASLLSLCLFTRRTDLIQGGEHLALDVLDVVHLVAQVQLHRVPSGGGLSKR